MCFNSFCTFVQLNRNYLDESVFSSNILAMKWLKYFHSLFQALVAYAVFLIFCFHPYNKSLYFFRFGSLQMFGFLMFDFFSLSWSSKVLSQKFVFAIWALLLYRNLHHFLCQIWPSAFLNFFSSFYSYPL